MVFNQNPEASRAILTGAKLSSSEGYPQNILPNIQAVMDMTPRFHKVADIIRIGTGNIYTVSTNKKFYMTNVHMSYNKVATDTGSQLYITATIDGIARNMFLMCSTTLVAEKDSVSVALTTPIIVDAGTTINLNVTGTFTQTYATITGYEVQNL